MPIALNYGSISHNDGPFKASLDRYKYPDRYENVDPIEQRGLAEVFLEKLEARLSAAPFLQGESFGKTDAAILPFIRQFANTNREWFDQAPYPALQAWLSSGLESTAFTRVMKKYRQWEESSLGKLFPPEAEITPS